MGTRFGPVQISKLVFALKDQSLDYSKEYRKKVLT